MDTEARHVKLTDLASCGGCAAKYSAARLEELLRGFVPVEASNLLVGLAPADDAAVYRLDDERALIFTLDFFPPVVDDPADYGAIAATNALNDVFAMGGVPLLALSIAAFPEELPMEMLARVFAAADEQVRAAGGLLAGGHAIRWMRTLNKDAADGLRPLSPNAVTDVTGFGLFGHAHEVAERSNVRIVLEADRLPAIDGALDLARKGVRTSGDPRTRDFAARHVRLDPGVSSATDALGFDPQTAGGLLVSLPQRKAPAL